MRIFLAGASGVIGIRLLPLLVGDGHRVAAMTRSPEKAGRLRSLGGEPVVCDVFDPDELSRAVGAFAPEMLMHQLTDLPDRLEQLGEYGARNDRMRTEGTRNLLAAAEAASVERFLAQSIAWRPPGRASAVDQLERQVLAASGVVLRYGQLYGPRTFYPDELPPHPRVHVVAAADITRSLLDAAPGVVVIAEDEQGRVDPKRLRAEPDGAKGDTRPDRHVASPWRAKEMTDKPLT
jgi:NAD(P)-dependent dehydrogenase (short-subunit alcohol dehydrogenase family)